MKKFSSYFLNELKSWFLDAWTLLQNLFGAILVLVTGAKKYEFKAHDKTYCYWLATRFNNSWSGVSLGDFIVFAKDNFVDEISVRHKYGHRTQSFILGPLYLIIIGFPSVLGNLWDRVVHRNWSCLDRITWYYTQPWEHWADLFAGLTLEDRGV